MRERLVPGLVDGGDGEELVVGDHVAQRLELFEDLNVVQNQDALEDLDVVAVLHTLQPQGKP